VVGRESKVARAHHAHVRAILEGKLDLTPELYDSLFECLLCKACVAHCFPAAETNEVMVAAREAYIARHGQPLLQRFFLRHVLKTQQRTAAYLRLPFLGKRLGLSGLANRLGVLRWFGADIARAEGIMDTVPLRFLRRRLKGQRLAPDSPKHTVAYFMSCGFNFALPEVGEATVRTLIRAGCAVEVLPNNCCGLPPYVYGDREAARNLARRNLELLTQTRADFIVTDCGSCSSFLRHYPKLFPDAPALRQQAVTFAARVREFSELLATIRSPLTTHYSPLTTSVTYHDPCHMSRYCKLTGPPRELLKRLPGVEFRELPEADWCCGAAGTYNIAHFDQSMAVLDRKMGNIERTKAQVVATSCPACMIQLAFGARRRKSPVRVMHVAQLLDTSATA